MAIEFILGIAVSLAIFGIMTFYFMKSRDNLESRTIPIQMFFIGLIHLIIAALSFLWLFGIMTYAKSDFLSIYSLLLLVQGFFIFLIIYNISEKNNKLLYFLFPYLIVFFSILFLDISFLNIFIAAYFLMVLLVSIILLSRKDDYRNIGVFGIFYSGFSLLLHVFVLTGIVRLYYFSIVYGALLLFFLIILARYLKENPLPLDEKSSKKTSYLSVFLRNFVFVLALINFIFIGTIVIHELGHLIISYFYNCASREIVLNFANGFADTQILCTNVTTKFFVSAGGPALPLIIGAALLFVGGKLLKEIGLLTIGFNFIIAYPDFIDMGMSPNFSIFIVLLGIIFAASGIILLAKSRTEDYVFSMENLAKNPT